MYQTILMHPDVDEGTEVGDVGHDAFEHHPGLQVGDLLDAFAKARGDELAAGISAGLLELGEDVAHGGQPEPFVDEDLWRQVRERIATADDLRGGLAHAFEDPLHHRIGLGMHRRRIERVVAARDPQEAGRLFEGLVAQPRYLAQRLARAERTLLVAMRDDALRDRCIEAGHSREQRHRRGVHVDAHRIHAVLDDRVQAARETALIDVVLVLAHADRFRIDLDQLGERILKAAGDRHRTAQADIEFRELARGERRCRIDRGARLGDGDLLQSELGVATLQIRGQPVGLARGRAVADRDQRRAMPTGDRGQHGDRAVPVATRLVREDRRGLEQLAGGRDYRDLHAGTQAGIQADHRLLARGRTEQQVLEIRAEHPDRLGVGGLAQAGEQFALEVDLQLHAPAPAQHVGEPAIGGRSVVGERPAELEQAREPCDTRMRLLRLAFSAEGQAQGQHALVPTAEQRERTVRRHGGNRLGMIEVVAELLGDLGGRSVLALHPLGCDRGLVPQEVAERRQHIGPLGEPLDEDVARAVERGLDVGDTPFG